MIGHFSSTLARVSDATRSMVAAVIRYKQSYKCLYNNQINAHALIGQSAMGYCASKPTEKLRVF